MSSCGNNPSNNTGNDTENSTKNTNKSSNNFGSNKFAVDFNHTQQLLAVYSASYSANYTACSPYTNYLQLFKLPLAINPLYAFTTNNPSLQRWWRHNLQQLILESTRMLFLKPENYHVAFHKYKSDAAKSLPNAWLHPQISNRPLNLATSSGRVIFRNASYEILYYEAAKGSVNFNSPNSKVLPMLLIPPWLKKFYIFDLNEQESMTRWLNTKGIDVFIISVNARSSESLHNPTARQAGSESGGQGGACQGKAWQKYALEILLPAINFLTTALNTKLNLASYCISGTMLSMLASYLAQLGVDVINSLTLLTTVFDFEEAGDIAMLIQASDLAEIFKSLPEVVDGKLLRLFFNLLRMREIVIKPFIDKYFSSANSCPLNIMPSNMLYWDADTVDIPKSLLFFTLQKLYKENAFVKKRVSWHNLSLDVAKINCPVFMIAAERDHITPMQAVINSFNLIKNNHPLNTLLIAKGGHLVGIINPPDLNPKAAYKRYVCKSAKDNTATTKENVVLEEEFIAGSWWNAWHIWLEQLPAQNTHLPSTLLTAPLRNVSILLNMLLNSKILEAMLSKDKNCCNSKNVTFADYGPAPGIYINN